MRFLFSLILTLGTATGAWWAWNSDLPIKDAVLSYIENGEFWTLEARYTPEQIMNEHEDELLVSSQRTFQDPSLKFYPYLLMEVKYTLSNKTTREGVILWSMVDGEMVLDTQNWTQTHGFADAINNNANEADFRILNLLARNGGVMSKQRLKKELGIDDETLDRWTNNAQKKYLIVQNGDEWRLHFQSPRFAVTPQTRIFQRLVTKSYNHVQQMSKQYSRQQIERIAKAAFGHDFAVRKAREVFLPVYSIEVVNPDGSVLTSYWNALNGQQVDTNYLTQVMP